MSTDTEKKVDNGVNVAALLAAREALTAAPQAAKFNWRATCKWVSGTHTQTGVKGFFGLGEQQSPSSPSTSTTPRSSPPRTRERRPWRWC
jgi:hypothetical protein